MNSIWNNCGNGLAVKWAEDRTQITHNGRVVITVTNDGGIQRNKRYKALSGTVQESADRLATIAQLAS